MKKDDDDVAHADTINADRIYYRYATVQYSTVQFSAAGENRIEARNESAEDLLVYYQSENILQTRYIQEKERGISSKHPASTTDFLIFLTCASDGRARKRELGFQKKGGVALQMSKWPRMLFS